ncbi:MAG: phosphatidylserine decarboxylase family protein, partial [Planctomycetes bacterium]|nr:phosphatidylserine decarboxylase family protein [Planctomycetota bacterium]
FAKGHIARMQQSRKGTCENCRHDILDPRDLKYCRNICGYYWRVEDDPFAWRDRLPVARMGLAELTIGSLLLIGIACVFCWLWWPAAVLALALIGPMAWFFRDPERAITEAPGAVLAPADGRIVAIDRIEDEFVGPAWSIGIFLSVFNVHLNRAPVDALVVGQTYRPGKFLNALRPQSARENESLELRLQQVENPHYRMRVRQIAGALARRIVCWVAPDQSVKRGCRFGMIKIGSRTELVLPHEVELNVRVGDKVTAGCTVVAWTKPTAGDPPATPPNIDGKGA